MAGNQVSVRVFAAPDASCGHGEKWSTATAFIAARLKHRFGDAVVAEHIEMFSRRSFEFPEVLAAVEAGGALPIVVVDGRIVSQGGKLSHQIIREAVASLLPAGTQPGRNGT